MKAAILALTLISVNAWSTNGPNNGNSDSRADSSSVANSASSSHAVALVESKISTTNVVKTGGASAKSFSEGGTAFAKGGEGGNGTGGNSDATGGEATGGDSTLNYSQEQVRQAPSVGLVAPSSTAPLSKCIGFGGSNETGSAIVGHCWLQRDLYAEHRAQQHAAAGRYEAAAKAQCSQKLFRADFKDKDDCMAQVHQSLLSMSLDVAYEEELTATHKELRDERERSARMEKEIPGGK